jgi:hypothetical protein
VDRSEEQAHNDRAEQTWTHTAFSRIQIVVISSRGKAEGGGANSMGRCLCLRRTHGQGTGRLDEACRKYG